MGNGELLGGKCQCLFEPKGHYGLEGYVQGEIYSFRRSDNRHMFVQPEEAEALDYWERCSLQVFNKFFKIVEDYGN